MLDRTRGRLARLCDTRPALRGRAGARAHGVLLRARDGLELTAYLTLPSRADRGGRGRPEAPLPLVLRVHGGPWARVEPGYDRLDQWLADRGHAVLAVNPRGSTGCGKAFVNAGDQELAGRMHDDLLDAVAWAIAEGIADPARIGIFGESIGGYAALVGLAFTPEVFACGVDLVGPSSLVTLLESFPPWAAPYLEATWYRRAADPRTAAGRRWLEERSPLGRADRICRPLLIALGCQDARVAPREAEQLVAALAHRGAPVTYALYPDEGHGFARPESWISFFAVAEEFLGRWLGGRVEPAGDDLAGSSLRLVHGAEHLPGIAAALAGRGPC